LRKQDGSIGIGRESLQEGKKREAHRHLDQAMLEDYDDTAALTVY